MVRYQKYFWVFIFLYAPLTLGQVQTTTTGALNRFFQEYKIPWSDVDTSGNGTFDCNDSFYTNAYRYGGNAPFDEFQEATLYRDIETESGRRFTFQCQYKPRVIEPMTLTLSPDPGSYETKYGEWGKYFVSCCEILPSIEVHIDAQGNVTCTNCSKIVSEITQEQYLTIENGFIGQWYTPQTTRESFTLNAMLQGTPIITSADEFSINVSVNGIKQEEEKTCVQSQPYGSGTAQDPAGWTLKVAPCNEFVTYHAGSGYYYTLSSDGTKNFNKVYTYKENYTYPSCNTSLYYNIYLYQTQDSAGLKHLFSK